MYLDPENYQFKNNDSDFEHMNNKLKIIRDKFESPIALYKTT